LIFLEIRMIIVQSFLDHINTLEWKIRCDPISIFIWTIIKQIELKDMTRNHVLGQEPLGSDPWNYVPAIRKAKLLDFSNEANNVKSKHKNKIIWLKIDVLQRNVLLFYQKSSKFLHNIKISIFLGINKVHFSQSKIDRIFYRTITGYSRLSPFVIYFSPSVVKYTKCSFKKPLNASR